MIAACGGVACTPDLRSQVLRGSTERLHGGRVGDPFFAQAEVGDLDVSVFVQHEVFQLRTRRRHEVMSICWAQVFTLRVGGSFYLQVSVNDLSRVQVVERRDDFGAVETRAVLRENSLSGQVEKQLWKRRRRREKRILAKSKWLFCRLDLIHFLFYLCRFYKYTSSKGVQESKQSERSHLSSVDVLHHKAEPVFGLEGVLQRLQRHASGLVRRAPGAAAAQRGAGTHREEGMPSVLQDPALRECVSDLVLRRRENNHSERKDEGLKGAEGGAAAAGTLAMMTSFLRIFMA